MESKVIFLWLLTNLPASFTFSSYGINQLNELYAEQHNLSIVPPVSSCYYGDEWYNSGDLVRSFPKKCLSFYCKSNTIYPINHYGEVEINCKMYKSGDKIHHVCVDIICKEGQWEVQNNFNPKCKRCNLQDDGHFTSFDNVVYDFNGLCNYSITQQGFGYASPWGVYGDFKPCFGARSCIDVITFVDDSNTVIEIEYSLPTRILVNGIQYIVPTTIQPVMAGTTPTPVLGWSHGNCISLLGTQGYYLQHCTYKSSLRKLSIWADPFLANNIYGLCGQFDYSTVNELVWRNGLTVSHPPSASSQPIGFGNSWITKKQSEDSKCPVPEEGNQAVEDKIVPVDCENDVFVKLKFYYCLELIGDKLHGQEADDQAEFCATDLCAMKQIGATEQDKAEYIRYFVDAIDNERFIKDHTRLPSEENGGNVNNVNIIDMNL